MVKERKTKSETAPAAVKAEKIAAAETKTVETKAVKPAAPAEEKAVKAAETKAVKASAAKAVKAVAEKAAKTVKAPKAPKAEKASEEVYLQYAGQEWAMSELKKKVHDAYAAEGHKAAAKKTVLYVKPEERKAYYVINDKSMGSVDL